MAINVVSVSNVNNQRALTLDVRNRYYIEQFDPWSYSVRHDDQDRLNADGGYFSIHTAAMKDFELKFCAFVPEDGSKTVWDIHREVGRVLTRGDTLSIIWSQDFGAGVEWFYINARMVDMRVPIRNINPNASSLDVWCRIRAADPRVYGVQSKSYILNRFGVLPSGTNFPLNIPFNVPQPDDYQDYVTAVNAGTITCFPNIWISMPPMHSDTLHTLTNRTNGNTFVFDGLEAGNNYFLEQGQVLRFRNASQGYANAFEKIATQHQRFGLEPGENDIKYEIGSNDDGATVSLFFQDTYL